MSTRSAVGIPQPNGSFKGRYIHSSGYPTWVGQRLRELVLRDGYQAVVETIVTGPHYGWSNLDLSTEANSVPDYKDDGRFVSVPGYGEAYTSRKIKGKESFTPQAKESDWVTDEDDWDTEWLYTLGETGIDVFAGAYQERAKKVGHVRYDDAEGMAKIEAQVYAKQ